MKATSIFRHRRQFFQSLAGPCLYDSFTNASHALEGQVIPHPLPLLIRAPQFPRATTLQTSQGSTPYWWIAVDLVGRVCRTAGTTPTHHLVLLSHCHDHLLVQSRTVARPLPVFTMNGRCSSRRRRSRPNSASCSGGRRRRRRSHRTPTHTCRSTTATPTTTEDEHSSGCNSMSHPSRIRLRRPIHVTTTTRGSPVLAWWVAQYKCITDMFRRHSPRLLQATSESI